MMPKKYPVTSHTDYIKPGSTFVAIKGMKEDGIQYIPQAIERGAQHIVIADNVQLPADLLQEIQEKNITVTHVPNPRKALAELSAKAAGYPAEKVKILAVTGTKGKTTTAFLLEHILRETGYKTALFSTVYNKIVNTVFKSDLTTPQPDYIHQFLKTCVARGVEYVVMEVAAQALTLHRVDGIYFDGIIFTNFSHEHLEFYETLDDYFRAKELVFDHLKKDAPCFINTDDTKVASLKQKFPYLFTFSLVADADSTATLSEEQIDSVIMIIRFEKKSSRFVCPSLMGIYNAYNVLGVASLLLKLGIDAADIAYALTTFTGVPGRLERYELPNKAIAIIDHAHNPQSFYAILSALRGLTPHLIVVFGAGGDRDPYKRPKMGAIAAQFADIVIITSDNPRTEDPQKIIADIQIGIPKDLQKRVAVIVDRKEAIEKAYQLSQFGSIIAILGKGVQEYQIVGNKEEFFSDREIVQQL